MNRKIVVLVCTLFVFVCPLNLSAWSGAGHNLQADFLLMVLPEVIRTFFTGTDSKENLIRKYVNYPDSFDPFDKELVGEKAMEILDKNGVKNRYFIHSNRIDGKGQVIAFQLLIDAFRNGEKERAAIWAGSLMHSIGDDFACNHGPLIHYLTYAFGPQKIKMGKGIGLDFGDLNTIRGRESIKQKLDGYNPKVLSDNPDEVVRKILIMPYHNASYMTQRERRIAATFKMEASENIIADGMAAMAEIGTEAIRQVADIIFTAWQYAKEGKLPEITEEIMNDFQNIRSEYLRSKLIENDSIYEGLLNPPSGTMSVGVVIEPTIKMEQCVFGIGTKYITSAIMHTLKDVGIPYIPIDIREVDISDLPSPDKVPVLIICSGNFSISKKVIEKFKNYSRSGGKIMVVGGEHKDILGELSSAMQKAQDEILPVTRRYGHSHIDVINNLSVKFLDSYAEVLGKERYIFLKNPNTPAGWQKPFCDWHIVSDSSSMKKLAEVSDGKKTITVAGALMENGGTAKYIFVPEYLMAPFLLSGEDVLVDPSRPYLDKVGRYLLSASLKLLRPDTENLDRILTAVDNYKK